MRNCRKFILIALFIAMAVGCTRGGFRPGDGTPTGAVVAPTATSGPDSPVSATAVPTSLPVPVETLASTERAPVSETMVVYAGDDGNLYLYSNRRMAVTRLTSGGGAVDVRVSPDGAYAAYLRDVGEVANEIWLAPTDASGERLLLSAAELSALDPSAFAVAPYLFEWAADSQSILFNTRKALEEGPGLVLFEDLRRIDIGTGAMTTVLPAGSAGGVFALSPDGSKVAFTKATGVHLVHADGTGLMVDITTFPSVITYSEYIYYPAPVWHPDSTAFVIAVPPADPLAIPPGPTDVFIISSGGALTAAGSLDGAEFFGAEAGISKDLQNAAYFRRLGALEENRTELVISDVSGAAPVVVASGEVGAFRFAWSMTGHELLFSQQDAGLFLAQVSGADWMVTELASGVQFETLNWLDDRTFIAWMYQGSGWRLVLGDTGGTMRMISEIADFINPADGRIVIPRP